MSDCWRRDSVDIMLQLHFTKDTLPDSVGSDFQTLNKFSQQVRIQYPSNNTDFMSVDGYV